MSYFSKIGYQSITHPPSHSKNPLNASVCVWATISVGRRGSGIDVTRTPTMIVDYKKLANIYVSMTRNL